MGRVALIDGDVLAYKACESRYKGGSIIPLNTEGKKIIKEFSEAEDRAYLEESWNVFNRKLKELLNEVFCTEYLMAVKGDGNFRDDIYCDYKIHRVSEDGIKNVFVPIIRKLAVAEDIAYEANGREADDMLRIWATECATFNIPYVVCTIDKDLKCIPGAYYHMGTPHTKPHMMTISAIEAERQFYTQLLKGDPNDHIPGLPGIGDVKAEKMLKPFSTVEDFQEIVVSNYLASYGDDWYGQLLSNGKMLYLQKNLNDYFTLRNWPLVQELIG
jgi:5'-3' exonuclease